MAETSTRMISPLAPLARLAGPVFGKELRVASRRRRTYLLRFVYVGALTLFVAQVLAVALRASGTTSAVVRMSKMGQAGATVVYSIVWFQFLLAQLLAIILLSGAIGGEVRQRSLDALLVTPVSSLQIVVGKLLGGLLQLVLLLVVSLPLLAVVRVFGGVPWEYVVFSLATILATALFAGSLSLLLSVTNQHASRVVSNAIGWCLVLWGGGPALLGLLRWAGYISGSAAGRILWLTNPFFVMGEETMSMLAASGTTPVMLRLWPVHLLVLLGGTVLMVLWATRRLRRVALAVVPDRGQRSAKATAGVADIWPWRRRVRPLTTGSPLVWRELRRPIFPRGRRGIINMLGLILGGGLLLAMLVYIVIRDISALGPLSYVVAGLLQVVFAVNLAGAAASTVAREKEARSLPILLTAPLGNGVILWGKALGLLRRNLPLLVPVPILGLVAYWLTPSDMISHGGVQAIVLSEVSAAGDVVLLLGLGLCLSAYLKTTTPAVVGTFVVYIAFRIVVGVVAGIVFLVGVRAGLFRPEDGVVRLSTTVLHLIGFSGLGVLLGYVAAAGLRRNCT
ncbi:MAG: ABC transporter permease subunit [Sedimentisphaerales bacterium]|nr:ABC transporter permease subunit [Sedimentisphaerales bacterium]